MNIASTWYKSVRRQAAGWKGPLRYQISRLTNNPDAFLKLCYGGVVHVGANYGQERICYSENKLKVVWIEAIPEVYTDLVRNLEPYPDQIAISALVTDRDGDSHTLHISNNFGMSSSIFELRDHKDIWPDVHYVREVTLTSMTLKTALEKAKVNPKDYDVLVMDTQGSELLVLKGADDILANFKFIKTEAADFEIYENCATSDQLCSFLGARGFRLIRKDEFARRENGGACFELLFARD